MKNSGGEKWGKSCTHSVRRAHDTPPTTHLNITQTRPLFIAIAAFLRGLGALREQRTPSRGGQWGAGWGTPGSGVGNPGERGGEHCGAAPGSRMENPGEQGGGTPSGPHNTTGQGIKWADPADHLSRQSHSTKNEVGRPGLPARPLSTAVCVRRQSSSLRLSQRRS